MAIRIFAALIIALAVMTPSIIRLAISLYRRRQAFGDLKRIVESSPCPVCGRRYDCSGNDACKNFLRNQSETSQAPPTLPAADLPNVYVAKGGFGSGRVITRGMRRD